MELDPLNVCCFSRIPLLGRSAILSSIFLSSLFTPFMNESDLFKSLFGEFRNNQSSRNSKMFQIQTSLYNYTGLGIIKRSWGFGSFRKIMRKDPKAMILWHFLLFSSIPLLSMLIQDAHCVYVPRVYGHVDPNPLTCRFITETGEIHQIYRIDHVYMFGRVYVLDACNARLINDNENHRRLCSESQMETLEDPRRRGPNVHEFRIHLRETNALAILSMGDAEICQMKGDEGLSYPVYSCQTSSSAPDGSPNPCPPAGHYFYLEESMNKQLSADTMPKLIVFTATDEQIRLCGGSQPTGYRFLLWIGNNHKGKPEIRTVETDSIVE